MGKRYTVYIGTNTVRSSRGIYTLDLDAEDGRLTLLGTTPAYNAGYLALAANHANLYAVSEGMTFQGQAAGGVLSFALDAERIPHFLDGKTTGGQRACCVNSSPDGKMLYACNFYRASVAGFPIRNDGSLGDMAFFRREEPLEGHHDGMHCVYVMQDGTICAISLGQNRVQFYHSESGEPLGSYAIPDGFDPRHLATSGDNTKIYLLMQRPGCIFVLENCMAEKKTLTLAQKISVIPEDYTGMYATAAIRMMPDGKYLLASTRGADTITVFRVHPADGLLTTVGITKLSGKFPRDFNITADGRYVVVGLQMSDEVVCYRFHEENGELEECGCVKGFASPAAVVIRTEEW